MKKAYEINWNTNTVTMTKKFAEEANQYGTDAYKMLMDVRSNGFKVVVRKDKPRKSCPTRITFKKMETILSCMSGPDERLAELHAVMDAGKGQKNQYEYVRKWFRANDPNFDASPDFDSENHIVARHLNALPSVTENVAKAS